MLDGRIETVPPLRHGVVDGAARSRIARQARDHTVQRGDRVGACESASDFAGATHIAQSLLSGAAPGPCLDGQLTREL